MVGRRRCYYQKTEVSEEAIFVSEKNPPLGRKGLIGKTTKQELSTDTLTPLLPSPREYTLGKLGLAIVKGYAMHLRNAMKKLGNKPPNNRRFNGAATTTDMSHNPTNNPTNREPVDAAI